MLAAMGERRSVHIEIAPKTILLILAAIAAVWLSVQLWHIAVLVLVALIVVGTLRPMVRGLERRGFGKRTAVLVVFGSAALVTLGLLAVSVPTLVSQVVDLIGQIPAKRRALIAWLERYDVTAPLAGVVRESSARDIFTRAGDYLLGFSPQVATGIAYAVTTAFLALYLLLDSERARGTLFAVVPRDYHLRLARILINLETIVGGYVRGQLITSAAIAVFMFGLLTACGVDNALPLAVFAGLTDVIPFVGGLLATVPAVLAALGRGLPIAVLVAIVLFVYQEVESRILVPRVYGRVLRLPPATVIVALLIGGALLGILGALLALPIAAGLRMMLHELRVGMPGDATDVTEVRRRDEAAERAYEELSAGTGPAEAAAIATDMAKEIGGPETLITGGEKKDEGE